jgi:hypothetical protein
MSQETRFHENGAARFNGILPRSIAIGVVLKRRTTTSLREVRVDK